MIVRRNKSHAFTLIELMIVIAIIGILAGILVPNMAKARAEAQLAGCKANLRAVATAYQTYMIRNKQSPFTHHPDGVDPYEMLVDAGYLKEKPICPATGQASYSDTTVGADSKIVIVCKGVNHSYCDVDGPLCDVNTGIVYDNWIEAGEALDRG